ncbi:MAG: formyltransferase family protein [Candidatus Delongbacteria bacterium]|nr:formyltransferase family protein [Candidatus Delongbacteria bacterium]
MNKPNIILWCGHQANQKALANKLHAAIGLSGIVLENPQRATSFNKITLTRIYQRIRFNKLHKTWYGLLNKYERKYPAWPDVPILNTGNINNDEVRRFSEQLKPDVILVSGTRLVKQKNLKTSVNIGIMNLHTGLSPYVKGGPNCTNWCFATGNYHLIGNSVMWIDAGIDSGNLIKTETTNLNGTETFFEVHYKVMEHAHQMYIDSLNRILKINHKVNAVDQKSFAKGKLYTNKMWDGSAKRKCLKGYKKFKKMPYHEIEKKKSNLFLVNSS